MGFGAQPPLRAGETCVTSILETEECSVNPPHVLHDDAEACSPFQTARTNSIYPLLDRTVLSLVRRRRRNSKTMPTTSAAAR